jgi:hypothetical protein
MAAVREQKWLTPTNILTYVTTVINTRVKDV